MKPCAGRPVDKHAAALDGVDGGLPSDAPLYVNEHFRVRCKHHVHTKWPQITEFTVFKTTRFRKYQLFLYLETASLRVYE